MPRKREEWWKCETDLHEHPKTVKLAELLNQDIHRAVAIVVLLLGAVRRHKKTGTLDGVTPKTIAHWCRWTKHKPAALVDALVAAGFLNREPSLHVHGWKERYAAFNTQRGVRGSVKVTTEVGTKEVHVCTEGGTEEVHAGNEGGTHRARAKTKTKTETKRTDAVSNETANTCDFPPEVLRLHEVYLEATGRSPTQFKFDPTKAAKYADLIGWAGSFEAAERGIRKIGASAFHRGTNPGGKRYDRLDDKPFRTAQAFLGWCEDIGPGLPLFQHQRPLSRAERLQAQIESVQWADEQPGYVPPGAASGEEGAAP